MGLGTEPTHEPVEVEKVGVAGFALLAPGPRVHRFHGGLDPQWPAENSLDERQVHRGAPAFGAGAQRQRNRVCGEMGAGNGSGGGCEGIAL